ncbi:sensor histidine kinase KdpD [Caballeronia sp. SBC2]|uniref:sensor histidine kinase n=1 Tax=Caballeronia sp. SBC2 TaxID=2705547 RepID=UPI0013E1356F|nr:HAMP domain-containing sensor histidine kinase [Caballeronia sp. SBC2]QIE29498.1 Adaptive-response sensory-kinase SasA [Caballeronia sp. SBC2]
MMHDFLANNRAELIERCRVKVAQRPKRAASAEQLQNGIPLFLEQLIKTLRIEQSTNPHDSREVSGPSGGMASLSEVGTSAALHGHELLRLGFSVDQVVHDYGDLCQAITDLAYERDAPFQITEFRTLNRCLDNAIADAVTEFSYQRDHAAADKQAHDANVQAGFFAHELRNALNVASLAFDAAKAGNLNLSGATGSVLQRGLMGLRTLIDRSLDDVRATVGQRAQAQLFALSDFIADVEYAAGLAADVRGSQLTVSQVDANLAVSGDRDLLYAAVGNLLQNAFKFTHNHTEVTLNAYAVGDRIIIDVKDHCGGLPPGSADRMFRPFTQNSTDRSGLGLGLSIARRSVEANEGTLTVCDVPSVGCVFTVSLPRFAMLGR